MYWKLSLQFISISFIIFQLLLQDESDVEGSTDEDDELKEINGGN